MRDSLWAAVAMFVFLAVAAAGCTITPATACFVPVAINPAARLAIIFDQCRGEIVYQNLPPLSTDRAKPEA